MTNVQFQAFLDAKNGYADDRWWRGLHNPGRIPQTPKWSEPNHPRETVSWYEAMAFCAWLGHELRLDVRLPTEWQWERAASGRDGREFPWGNEYLAGYANVIERAGEHWLSCTSAVGIYPQGASMEGILDLAGNIWEWCLNEYQEPERVQAGGTEPRVMRGDSSNNLQDFARAQLRSHFNPINRSFEVGFRVVVVLSPIEKLST